MVFNSWRLRYILTRMERPERMRHLRVSLPCSLASNLPIVEFISAVVSKAFQVLSGGWLTPVQDSF